MKKSVMKSRGGLRCGATTVLCVLWASSAWAAGPVPDGISQTTLGTDTPDQVASTSPTSVTSTSDPDLVLSSKASTVVYANNDNSWTNEGFSVVAGTGTSAGFITTFDTTPVGTNITNAGGASLTVGSTPGAPVDANSINPANAISLSSNNNTMTATGGGTNNIIGTTNINSSGNFATNIGGAGTAPVTIASGTNSIVTSNNSVAVTGGGNTMTVNSSGVTLANTGSGAPVQIHGVADGTSAHDAVAFEQLTAQGDQFNQALISQGDQFNQALQAQGDQFNKSMKAQGHRLDGGIASTVAMAQLPQVEQGKNFSAALGFGGYDGESGVAFGLSARVHDNGIIKASVGTGFSGAGNEATYGVGIGWSW